MFRVPNDRKKAKRYTSTIVDSAISTASKIAAHFKACPAGCPAGGPHECGVGTPVQVRIESDGREFGIPERERIGRERLAWMRKKWLGE